MKITFLGTSHGVPSASRYCSSALVECGDNVYLIDGGAPVADLLIRYGIPYEKLRGVFVTHMHSDHTFGLLHLCSLADWYFRQSSFDVFLPEEEGIDAFRRLLLVSDKSFDEERIRLKKSCSGVMYADGCLTVSPPWLICWRGKESGSSLRAICTDRMPPISLRPRCSSHPTPLSAKWRISVRK